MNDTDGFVRKMREQAAKSRAICATTKGQKMLKSQWESDRDHRLAEVFREKHGLAGKMLILQAQEWGTREEREAEELRREIDECDKDIERISNETYDQAVKDDAASRADEARKERR